MLYCFLAYLPELVILWDKVMGHACKSWVKFGLVESSLSHAFKNEFQSNVKQAHSTRMVALTFLAHCQSLIGLINVKTTSVAFHPWTTSTERVIEPGQEVHPHGSIR